MKNPLKYGTMLAITGLAGILVIMWFFPGVQAQDVDEERVVQIAREIARGAGENNPIVEIVRPVLAEQVTLLDLSEIASGLDPQERLWEIRLRGKFLIPRGPVGVRGIRSDGFVLILRASDGSVLAWGTTGNTTLERVGD